jgi:protein SCO1
MSRPTIVAFALLLATAGAPLAAQPEPGAHHHPTAAPSAAPAPQEAESTILEVPDVAVLDQEGRPLHFHSDLVRGRTVAVNFIFTTCTTICPPLAATFGKLRLLLAEKGRDVQLISISVDPATDTPERLKAWSQKFGAGPGWTLVTGRKEDIGRLLKALGAYTADINDHAPLVLIANSHGRWTRAYGLAPPAKLAAAIDALTALGAGDGEDAGSAGGSHP